MAIIFDGKTFASEIERELQIKVQNLKERGIGIKFGIISVGENRASEIYMNLKKKVAQRIGIECEIYKFSEDAGKDEILNKIDELNNDVNTTGFMIQMPIADKLKQHADEFVNRINLKKDVDGMGENSKFKPATVKAILKILETQNIANKKILIIGNKGFVGSRLIKELISRNYDVDGLDKEDFDEEKILNADVVISVTGQENLIKGNMIKDGVMIIDAGAPKGDAEFESVVNKASFITPVPGGVGPVTVISLMENVIEAAGML